jgi:RHS repeat-associated protein
LTTRSANGHLGHCRDARRWALACNRARRRVRHSSNAVRVRSFRDHNDIWSGEFEHGSIQWTRERCNRAVRLPRAVLQAETPTLISEDPIGLADASGAVQTSYTFRPFGESTVFGAATTNATLFTGREDDGTGLIFDRYRYYSAAEGRFVDEDPLGLAGGTNLYAYANDQPTQWTDPLGLWALNRKATPIFIKPEEPDKPVCRLDPGGFFPDPVDGFSDPDKPGYVYKNPDHTDIVVDPDGPATLFPSTGVPMPYPLTGPPQIRVPAIRPFWPATRFFPAWPGWGWIPSTQMHRLHPDWDPLSDPVNPSPEGHRKPPPKKCEP